MQIPSGSLDTIRSGLDTVLGELARESADGAPPPEPGGADLPALVQAFDQLLDVMSCVEADLQQQGEARSPHRAGPAEITELGEYALKLHENLVALAAQAGYDDGTVVMAGIAIDFGLWIAAHAGQIVILEPVVDALARPANATVPPRELEALTRVIERLIPAVAPLIREDLEKMNPGRPWRLLLLNYGIVATRSHNTAVMETAFATLTRHLPEDAGRFFQEGMQQMEALDYPPPVRRVMEKYHRRWNPDRSLH
jgi:hypothetical protein